MVGSRTMIQDLLQQFAARCSGGNFFGVPTWHKYLTKTGPDCSVQFELMKNGKFNGDGLLLIGLGVIDILIRIASLVAIAFVLYGGIKYITSQGSPEGTKSAQNTILNAVVGLVISVIAAAVVGFLGKAIA